MGRIMATALSKLFKENEGLIQAARAVANAAIAGDVTCEKIVSLDGTSSAQAGTYSFRLEFMEQQDFDAFVAAMDELHLRVAEE